MRENNMTTIRNLQGLTEREIRRILRRIDAKMPVAYSDYSIAMLARNTKWIAE
jgi:hypothetical protein